MDTVLRWIDHADLDIARMVVNCVGNLLLHPFPVDLATDYLVFIYGQILKVLKMHQDLKDRRLRKVNMHCLDEIMMNEFSLIFSWLLVVFEHCI